ncbi:TetR/AcrR family transcriptional regulator [Streptomyces sp. 4N509B]|uniref:TetR/AcrR family transcriptional regulator n=1 Tax=Streptomyces sp. 4N509B TaxID=3457413 RepID=UPI003FD0AEE3
MSRSTRRRRDQPPPRLRLLDAAISLVAREGLQHLSHRRVEREAGLTHGSTTYYFRTREAMIREIIDHLAERDRRTMTTVLGSARRPVAAGGGAGAEPVLDQATELLATALEAFLTTAREQTVARFELFLHAAREPSLREELTRWRGLFQRAAEAFLREVGAPASAEDADALVTGVDGVLLAGVCLPGPPSPDGLRRQTRALLERCLPPAP